MTTTNDNRTNLMPWLIGEMNPHQKPGTDPDHKFDLYPLPRGASGHRLCKLVLDMEMTTYLRSFVRRDLLIGSKWSVPQARKAAAAVWSESKGAPLILLGTKVSAAFGFAFEPFTFVRRDAVVGDRRILILPHPSGLCRAWDEPLAFRRARELVLPLLATAEAT